MVGESLEQPWGSNGLISLGITVGHGAYLVMSITIPRQIYGTCLMGGIG